MVATKVNIGGKSLSESMKLSVKELKRSDPARQAVIKISGNTLESNMRRVGAHLAALSRMGLTPIVVHGGGRQIDLELERRGIEAKKVNGIRITDRETMEVVHSVLNKLTDRLVEMVKRYGGSAINANGMGIMEVKKRHQFAGVDPGLVGEIRGIDEKLLISLCGDGYLPILASLGQNKRAEYNINADTMASQLVEVLHPKKFILLTETGGVLDKKGRIIHELDLNSDFAKLAKEGVITEGMLLKMQEIKMLMKADRSVDIVVCSAGDLVQELLFGHESGTRITYGKR